MPRELLLLMNVTAPLDYQVLAMNYLLNLSLNMREISQFSLLVFSILFRLQFKTFGETLNFPARSDMHQMVQSLDWLS